jgi:hypothetical protein
VPNSRDREQIQSLAQRILAKCAQKLGGVGALAQHLGVGEATVAEWMTGRHVPNTDVMLKAVAPLLEEPTPFERGNEERPPKLQ